MPAHAAGIFISGIGDEIRARLRCISLMSLDTPLIMPGLVLAMTK
ncbi:MULTISPECIES: hypothetical protein [Rhodopseudomonas]|nr:MULTISPECIES: hypothetical protein [Rhodopseudomonas]